MGAKKVGARPFKKHASLSDRRADQVGLDWTLNAQVLVDSMFSRGSTRKARGADVVKMNGTL